MKKVHYSYRAIIFAAIIIFQSISLPNQAQWATVDVKQETPTYVYVLIGVGSALVITGLIILIVNKSKKKKTKANPISFNRDYQLQTKTDKILFMPKSSYKSCEYGVKNNYSGFIQRSFENSWKLEPLKNSCNSFSAKPILFTANYR